MGMKKQKLLEQFSANASEEQSEGNIFSGVCIFVNGWTEPSSDELKRIMMIHGGVFHHYRNHQTTHIIASNLPDVKVRQLKGDERIVKPEWITASVAAGKLLDCSQYLLMFNQDKNQQKITFQPVSVSNDKNPTDSKEKVEDSKWVAKDATDSRFLGEFFNNSRLHHIATMGANAKDYVSALRSEHDGTFPARESLAEIRNTAGTGVGPAKTIMHIDMDCFFVSVGLRTRPELRGRAVVVTHARGNKPSLGAEQDQAAAERRRAELAQYQQKRDSRAGLRQEGESRERDWKLDNIDGTSSMAEIASCSYEARKKGVRNGMFLGPALKLCPDLVPIPYDFEGYESVSKTLYDTVASYTLEMMAVSCDEMYVDLTSLCRDLTMDPLLFVSRLREEIRTKTGCNCSVGLGPNNLLSRLATKKAKPDGQFLLTEETSAEMLAEMQVSELPGVGRSLEQKLSNIGVALVSHLSKLTLAKLQQEFGNKTGQNLYNMARGRDERKLELDHVRKTVSAEVNYGIRFKNWEEAEAFLQQLSGEVVSRMTKLKVTGRNITLKLMIRAANAPEETAKYNGHGVCDNMSRSVQLHTPTDKVEVVFKEVLNLVKACSDLSPSDLRGVGITISKLEKINAGKNSASNSILKFMKNKKKSPIPASSKTVQGDDQSNFGVENGNFPQDSKQLNLEVLKELPPEIRAEVEAEYNIGPSTSKLTDPRSATGVNPPEEDNSNSCDISFSQLDQDVLSELPPELQIEINRHFSVNEGQEKRVANPAGTKTAFDALMTVTSPRKDIKSRRGRKKGSVNRAKKLNSPKKVGAKTAVFGHLETEDDGSCASVDIDVFNSLPENIKAEVAAQMKMLSGKIEPDNSKETTVGTSAETVDKKTEGPVKHRKGKKKVLREKRKYEEESQEYLPSFMGRTGLENIRALLKDWVSSTDCPVSDDLNLLDDFLLDLIKNREIDLVRILIKCLHRNILKRNRAELWKQTWKSLVIKTQSVMKAIYRNPLLITERF